MMNIRGCSSSHFILSIQDGEVKKVHNINSHGRPTIKFKKLEDVYPSTNGEYTPVPLAERKTRAINGYVDEDNEQNCPSDENDLEEITLLQIRRKCKRKKRKASESILLTPKVEDDDDPDLSELLCKFRVRVSKSPRSKSKSTPGNGNSPTSCTKDLAIVKVKTEAPEVDYFECRKTSDIADNFLICNEPVKLIASESELVIVDDELKSRESESFPNEGGKGGFNKVSFHNFENMELEHEENMPNILLEDDSSVKDLATSTPDCSQSQLYLDQRPEEVNYTCNVQDSESTIDDDVYMVEPRNQEYDSLNLTPDSWSNPADHDDVGPMEVNSPISEEKQDLTSVNTDADSNSLNSNNDSPVSEEISVFYKHPDLDSANVEKEVKFYDHNHQTDCMETRHAERLPVTRKAISPNSQEKLCFAMKSAELLDDMDLFKCKEKLNFEEQPEDKFSSTTSDVEDNEPNLHPLQSTQLIQNKVYISPKVLLKRKKIFKKGSPPKSLDGPRLCRSLPRLSTQCTSIQGCSENAIAFSQRQMHDIESLASKLMSELDSMKAIVENKLLYEAYRSTSLKNESDEVKSAIKSATKTEETAKKWLSMMTRDCNRFCKIMKLNEDNNTCTCADSNSLSPSEKGVEREKKKISFADEAGGTLCHIKEYQIDRDSQELNDKPPLLSLQ